MKTGYKNWYVKIRSNIAWLFFDKKGEKVNSLDKHSVDELGEIIDEITHDKEIKAIIITSAKDTGFIYGADIKSFLNFNGEEDVRDIVEAGHKAFAKLASAPVTTVALINGFCLGGGLELALSCDFRVAEESFKPTLGLPEVGLGLQPAWRGTVALPRLIGAADAIPLMLTGKIINTKKAYKLGLLDAAVPKRFLEDAAIFYATSKVMPRKLSYWKSWWSDKLLRMVIYKKAVANLKSKISKEHYPAPYAIIENFNKYGVGDKALQVEIDSMQKVAVTDTARNLIKIFFLREKLKSAFKDQRASLRHVHVIGAGVMGADIALVAAAAGYKVTLQDLDNKVLAKAMLRAQKYFKRKFKKGCLLMKAQDNFILDTKGVGVKHADLIIEAIVEKLEVKQQVFKHIEQHAKTTAILATNTSSIKLEEIAEVMQDKSRLVGIHFFNPVPKMPLVELIISDNTQATVLNAAAQFVLKLGKIPLKVKSSPGFLVNRVLAPYMLEAVLLVEEGVKPQHIDYAMRAFGMPQGPVELADMVGLDVCLAVGEVLKTNFNENIPKLLTEKVAQGHLGKKSGRGFYTYDKKGKMTQKLYPPAANDQAKITDRLVLRYLNEAVSALGDKIVDDIPSLDAGMVFGTGFAPFRGGPINYIQAQGKDNILATLQGLQQNTGIRFAEKGGWDLV